MVICLWFKEPLLPVDSFSLTIGDQIRKNLILTGLDIDGVQKPFQQCVKSTSNLIPANQEKDDGKNNVGSVSKTSFSYSIKAGTLQAFEFPPSRGNDNRRQKAT